MRATAEDEDLAASLGVNTKFVHVFSWFISGALSALAGAIMPLWTMTAIDYNDRLLVSVMAGSVLGGLTSIYGAIIGGLFVALSQKLLSYLLILAFGVQMGAYEALLPIIILFLVLAIEPNGITGFRGKEITFHHVKTSLMNFVKAMRNMFNLEW
jgi:branched-chain amino acid transport system permease protein